ncbi:MAG TPA: helix-turn-helix transcriptional regulator [Rhizomicrobium sp.]|jgi:transcriptional regulator with XRE-family HTH domain|nr:helix-turn-helix transcriptional regulator [Rhizomicrobium sp.]
MALFFDTAWFDARLAATGLTRAQLAAALGLSEEQVAEIWKDQREISAKEVAMLAALFGATVEEIAHHAGISTPVPKAEAPGIEARLTKVERELAELKAQVAAMRKP